MATSVPQVRSIEDLKWQCARMVELAQEAMRLSGSVSYVELAMPVVRAAHQELKLMANLGSYDRSYVEKLGKTIDRLDDAITEHKAKIGLALPSQITTDVPSA